MAALTDFQEIKLLLSEEGSIKLENAGAIFKTIDDFISTTLKSLSDRKFTCDSSLVEVLELIFTSFIAREPLNEGVLCLTNCFRLCRNLLAIDPSCQAEFLTSTLLQQTCSVLYKVLNKQQRSENEIVLLRCSVQFLGNFCSGNKANTYEVWKHCRQLFRDLLKAEDNKLQEYVLLVVNLILSCPTIDKDILTCRQNGPEPMDEGLKKSPTHVECSPLHGNGDPTKVSTDQTLRGEIGPAPALENEAETVWSLLKDCLNITADTQSENGLLVVEACLTLPDCLGNVFPNLSLKTRLLALEVSLSILGRLSDGSPGGGGGGADPPAHQPPHISNLLFLAADFVHQHSLIPELASTHSAEDKVLCIVKELECLCLATALHQMYATLQDNDQLLTTAIKLLSDIEDLGSQEGGVFSPVDKISRGSEVNTDHPVYGLKRDLIQLVANLVYRNTHNQNMVRELDAIPLILNKTTIDARNPFICQWAVFAAHNLTEGNEENRAYIRALRLEGMANNQALLDEMGLSAEMKGDRVVVKKAKTN
ncbi:ataxin-10-like [Mya arenaria]|uniref:ataxin-10-like n=1 Tax=Mya arenaria TaxID=6604 RepID=UPI0022E06F20|nr:ataxin-10-like [Mya arenaria]